MAVTIKVMSGAKWQMFGQFRYPLATVFFAICATTVQAAEKSVSTCTSGDLVRRVIVEVGNVGTGLPCEVVYWKDTEAPGVRRVLWNARSDAAYCDSQAAGLVDKLANAGWNCSNSGSPLPVNAAPAPAPNPPQQTATAPVPSTTVPALDAATVATNGTTESQPLPQPETTAALGTTQQPQPAPSTSGSQTAALAPAVGNAANSLDQLQSVIQANLSSLNQSVDGDFEAEIGDFGDLNSDGIDDAVVFFNYESSTADFTQFVAAYLFNGEKYHLAATKPVGGTDLAVRQVEVEGIVQGSIQLRLVLNDAAQTEDRRAAMILRDGQLVETQ